MKTQSTPLSLHRGWSRVNTVASCAAGMIQTALLCSGATFLNGSFESNPDFTGWNSPIGIRLVGTASSIGITPAHLSDQALFVTGPKAQLTPNGQSPVAAAALETYFGIPTGGLNSFSDFLTTSSTFSVVEGSGITQSFTTSAADLGAFLNFSFSVLTDEDPNFFPNNDFGFISVSVNSGTPTLYRLADLSTAFAYDEDLAGDTDFDFKLQNGYQAKHFQINAVGTYTVGFGVVDVGSSTLATGLLVDAVSISGTSNGTLLTGGFVPVPEPWEWSLVGGLGLCAFAVLRRFRQRKTPISEAR